jgi:hypothetical protein
MPPQASDCQPTANDDDDDEFSGGADRDRTGGLLVANQALSQLSYSPMTGLPAPGRELVAKPV